MPRVLRINADFECAKACFEHQCDMHSLRYGKFCGVGHGGCPGEEPCDAVDACCQVHDDCVEAEGLLAESCHKDFLACLRRVREEEPADSGFSTTCPYAMVIPNMEDGIELSLKLAGLVKNLMGSAAQQAS